MRAFIDLVEAAERYRGVVEPGSRPRWGQEVVFHKPVVAYHATHEGIGKILTNREIRTYDSMGTWFSSSKDMAAHMYGEHVEAYHIPPGRYLIAKRRQDFWEMVLNCLPIIARTVGKEAADHLAKYPLTGPNIAFVERMRKDAKTEMGFAPDDYSVGYGEIDRFIKDSLRRRDPERLQKFQGLLASNKYYRQVCLNAEYCRQYRAMLEEVGIQGLIFNGRHWDGAPQRSTIFLVFHAEDLHPIPPEAIGRVVATSDRGSF